MRTLSVIIPTRNRPAVAAECVRALLAQDHPSFDVAAVDQSDAEPTALWALAKSDPRVRVLRSDPPGTTHARNVGVTGTTGEIVVFLDDDAVALNRGFLAAHDHAYDDPGVVGVAGRVLELRDHRAMEGPLLKLSRWGTVYPNASGTEAANVDHARGGNMSFRRSVVERVGPFDERYRGNAMREETDYSLRARRFGTIRFVPEAEVEHRQHPSGGSRTQTDRIRWYGDFFFNEALFFGTHFPRWMRPVLVVRKLRPIVACVVYYGHLRPTALTAPLIGLRDGFAAADRPHR